MQLLRYLEENRAVCRCALQSLGRSYISMFFRDDIHAIIHRTVDELHRQAHFLQAPEQGELLTQFYVIALAGVVESWVLGELKCSAEELVDFIDRLLTDQLPAGSPYSSSRFGKYSGEPSSPERYSASPIRSGLRLSLPFL